MGGGICFDLQHRDEREWQMAADAMPGTRSKIQAWTNPSLLVVLWCEQCEGAPVCVCVREREFETKRGSTEVGGKSFDDHVRRLVDSSRALHPCTTCLGRRPSSPCCH